MYLLSDLSTSTGSSLLSLPAKPPVASDPYHTEFIINSDGDVMATERVLIMLDVTKDEAWDIANKLAGGPPKFVQTANKLLDVPAVLEMALNHGGGSPRIYFSLRSEKSAALGGKDTPNLKLDN